MSTVPNTINEMLMQSHEGTIKLFPVWPKDHDAEFHQLRAYGAFLIDSELKGGNVQYVKVLSEKGRNCSIKNPWPQKTVKLLRSGEQIEIIDGYVLQFATNEGDFLLLAPGEELAD